MTSRMISCFPNTRSFNKRATVTSTQLPPSPTRRNRGSGRGGRTGVKRPPNYVIVGQVQQPEQEPRSLSSTCRRIHVKSPPLPTIPVWALLLASGIGKNPQTRAGFVETRCLWEKSRCDFKVKTSGITRFLIFSGHRDQCVMQYEVCVLWIFHECR
ncbi:hypothetical protein J6590_012330 [Homalodisca vitripennis]|nr:hypothetical protein J6590_012330 [Homalodisca vitripennis]